MRLQEILKKKKRLSLSLIFVSPYVRNGPLLNPFSRIEDFVDDERDVADGEKTVAIHVGLEVDIFY